MKVLIGTTNPSKLRRFKELLSGYDIEFYSLHDLGIDTEPDEVGKTPEENAAIKASFYGQYFDKVVCNDSGLYFDSLSLDDPRQPGLNIRAPKGKRLSDEEMIEYYASLVKSLGGRMLAYYLDGIAIYNCGKITTYMENSEATRASAFYMVDKPTPERHAGWPLDSISINRNTMNYFTHAGDNKYDTTNENIMLGEYRKRLRSFMAKALGVEPMTEKELWETFITENKIADRKYEAWSFGTEADLLAHLVELGEKTATSSAYPLYELENEPLPAVGEYSVILDSKDNAVCIIQTKKVSVVPFNKVTEEHAYKEGEGDKSLDFWRVVHEKFFMKCLGEVGLNFTPDMKVVCEEFEVVYKR